MNELPIHGLGIARLREIGKRGLGGRPRQPELGVRGCVRALKSATRCRTPKRLVGSLAPPLAGLAKSFFAAQIAALLVLPQSAEIYFFTIFPSKTGRFMNRPALGIGFA